MFVFSSMLWLYLYFNKYKAMDDENYFSIVKVAQGTKILKKKKPTRLDNNEVTKKCVKIVLNENVIDIENKNKCEFSMNVDKQWLMIIGINEVVRHKKYSKFIIKLSTHVKCHNFLLNLYARLGTWESTNANDCCIYKSSMKVWKKHHSYPIDTRAN